MTGGLQSGVAKSPTRLSDFDFTWLVYLVYLHFIIDVGEMMHSDSWFSLQPPRGLVIRVFLMLSPLDTWRWIIISGALFCALYGVEQHSQLLPLDARSIISPAVTTEKHPQALTYVPQGAKRWGTPLWRNFPNSSERMHSSFILYVFPPQIYFKIVDWACCVNFCCIVTRFSY